eukprot:scaffold62440_cov27-Tisochrysis_lutea.AAC.1
MADPQRNAGRRSIKVHETTGTTLSAYRVDGKPAACRLQALHVALLGAPQPNDALFGQHVQGDGVDALLVDHHKALVWRAATHLQGVHRVYHDLSGENVVQLLLHLQFRGHASGLPKGAHAPIASSRPLTQPAAHHATSHQHRMHLASSTNAFSNLCT